MNPTNIHEDKSLIPGLAHRVEDLAISCGVDQRSCSDPTMLWLWCKLASVALIRPLAGKLRNEESEAQKQKKKKKKKKKVHHILIIPLPFQSQSFLFYTTNWVKKEHLNHLK